MIRPLKFALPLFALFLGAWRPVVLNSQGLIGREESGIIVTATILMLIVVVPVIFLVLFFAWRYRASNSKAAYSPDWSHSNKIEFIIWLVPCAIVATLSAITWSTTHTLDPYRPLASKVKPVVIDAVSLNWKWLFIYPEQHVAAVNQLAFPVDTPVVFHITSATVMNSFFIPQLGSQIYAMDGMQTTVSLSADHPGTYAGISANFSGDGFSGMKFDAIATSNAGFASWIAGARKSAAHLTDASYGKLAEPSETVPVSYYSDVEPNLFRHVLFAHLGPGEPLKIPLGSEGEDAGSTVSMCNMPMSMKKVEKC